MSNSIFIPSHFASPFITTIPNMQYDSKGRLLGFKESEVQRLERLAFVNATKSRSGSPTESPTSSAPSSPRRKLISEPYGDPIELMANRLAEEYFDSDELSSSSDEDFEVVYSKSQHARRVPSSSSSHSSTSKNVVATSKAGHRRKRSSLSSIPEED